MAEKRGLDKFVGLKNDCIFLKSLKNMLVLLL